MTVRAFEEGRRQRLFGRGRKQEQGEPEWTQTPRAERDRDLDRHHVTETVPPDFRTIDGWGVDLHERPMFPRELPSDVKTVRGEVRDWQVPPHRIFSSIEHPNLTPVFGTTCPPKGLSGMLRSYAYRYSEATNRHWMMLILADRIDMIESMAGDALRGKPDRYVKEKAWGAFFKYGDKDDRTKALLTAGAVALGVIAIATVAGLKMTED